MPIYVYRCQACGHKMDVLQKLSAPALTKCPVCAEEKMKKQMTAAAFRLKGTGWYETDFKNNGKKDNKSVSTASTSDQETDKKSTKSSPDSHAVAKSAKASSNTVAETTA